MNDLILHLEYLLHSHNCVIVPNLGGFVVNTTPVIREGLAAYYAPTTEVVFNRDLTYDDGLLIESFMRVDKISSETAQQKIKSAVKEIKDTLRDRKEVSLGDLGKFKVTDKNNFEYTSLPFIRPEYYGMTQASLQPVLQLQPKVTESTVEYTDKKQPQRTYMWRNIGIATAAAAIIVFILTLLPVQDNTHHQTAQVLTEKKLFNTKDKKNNNLLKQSIVSSQETIEEVILPTKENTILDNIVDTSDDTAQSTSTISSSVADDDQAPQYYIIVGVYEVKNYAMNMLNQLKEEGYTNANTFVKYDRTNVYCDSYPTIEEAHNALNSLIRKNSNHSEAWILKR